MTRVQVRSREPFTSLILQTSSRNFSRAASVRVPQASVPGCDGPKSAAARLTDSTFRDSIVRICGSTSGATRRPVRDRDRNRDSPPLEITGVKAEGSVYRLVFLGSPGRSLSRRYGSDVAESPRYDTAAVLSSLRTGYRPASLVPGTQVEDPRYRARACLAQPAGRPIVLIVVLVLMVAVLTWILLRRGRRSRSSPSMRCRVRSTKSVPSSFVLPDPSLHLQSSARPSDRPSSADRRWQRRKREVDCKTHHLLYRRLCITDRHA